MKKCEKAFLEYMNNPAGNRYEGGIETDVFRDAFMAGWLAHDNETFKKFQYDIQEALRKTKEVEE